jgi:hypothetical protein
MPYPQKQRFPNRKHPIGTLGTHSQIEWFYLIIADKRGVCLPVFG